MTKGWNIEYLDSMSKKYDSLSKIEKNPETKLRYEEITELYQFLIMKLIFQQGEVFYSDVTTKDFLSEYNEANNLHIYPGYYDRIMNKFTLEIEKKPRIMVPNYKRKITKDESFEIVGDFIKYYFGDEGYDIYKTSILDKPEYTLFDRIDDISSATFVNDEIYLTLADFNDIRFTSALAHEAGHITKSTINNLSSNDNLLGEFESFSYQIRLLIFMINKKIYQRDALKELLGLMNLVEKILIVKYYNNIYKLNKIKDPNYFDAQIEKLKLKEKAGIRKEREVYDSIASVLEKDYTMYIYSLLAVFGELTNPKYLETYYDVISNLGKVEHKKLVRRNNISVNQGMNNYLELRSELMKML